MDQKMLAEMLLASMFGMLDDASDFDYSSIEKLHNLLDEHNIPHSYGQRYNNKVIRYYGITPLEETTMDGYCDSTVFDIIMGPSTYGGKEGLLEAEGPTGKVSTHCGPVEVSADEMFEIIKAYHEKLLKA